MTKKFKKLIDLETIANDVANSNIITLHSKFECLEKDRPVLDSIIELFSRCKYFYFHLLNNPLKKKAWIIENAKVILVEKDNVMIETQESFKVAFSRIFGLSSRQFNSLEYEVKASFESSMECQKLNVINKKDRIEKYKEKLKAIQSTLKLDVICDAYVRLKTEKMIEKVKKNKKLAFELSRKINRYLKDIETLETNIKNNKVSVCFGDTKVLKSLSSLFNDSNYSHSKFKNISYDSKKSYQSDYRKLWQESRYNQFVSIGSKDENNGNSSCHLSFTGDHYEIRISIPPSIIEIFQLTCKHIVVGSINFKYKNEQLLQMFANQDERKQKEKEYNELLKSNSKLLLVEKFDKKTESMNKVIMTKYEYLENYGQAITIRIIKDYEKYNKYKIHVSFKEANIKKAITSKSNGVISADINIDHFALANIDKNKRLIKAFAIDYGFSDKMKNSNNEIRKSQIVKAVKTLIDYSIINKKPIVIEQLDFQKKRNLLKEENAYYDKAAKKRRNRVLSSFAYKMIIDTIKIMACRKGIAVYEVNPAFTSQIGYYKYAKKYGISKHMAAAYVIGRRSYGIEELFEKTFEVVVKGKVKTLNLLVDRDNCLNYFDYCQKNSKGFLKSLLSETSS